MRTIIIGDVHGCYSTLQSLLTKIKPIPEYDRLIFLGDLFDRGPDSLQVFQTVQKLAEEFKQNFVLLRGNHEDYLLQPQLTLWQRIIWERVGRAATVHSFMEAGQKMEDAIPWIREHSCLYWKGDRFQCVHAGVKVEPLEVNDLQTLIHDHEVVFENRYNGKMTITGHVALEKATWFTGDGETAIELEEDKGYTLPDVGVICIDTGCGKGGRLTAMIIEDNSYRLTSAE